MQLRRSCACAVALGAALVTSRARADLKVRWDCYLPDPSVDCTALMTSLTAKIPFLRVVPSRAEADVVAKLTSVPAEGGTRFEFDFVGKPIDGRATEVHTTDKVPSSIDLPTVTVRILSKLERGLDDFMSQKTVAEVRDGTLDIQVSDPAELPFVGRPEQTSVKWYVAPTVAAIFNEIEGVGINALGTVLVPLNYSEGTWRAQQTLGISYSRQSQPVPGTTETASIQLEGASATNVLSWSLFGARQWNMGLLLGAEKNPQANYRFRANGSVGLEFDMVPRQTVDQKNLGFRCAVGPEFQRYDAINIEGFDQQLIARQFCDIFLSWHFAPIDLTGSLGETSVLEKPAYHGFSATFSAAWRLTDNLVISPQVIVQQINRAINEGEPVNAAYADPRQEIEASMLAAVQQGYTAPFGIQSGLSIRYLLGNGSLSVEDQRWRGATNLR